jgi:hypothetical protein
MKPETADALALSTLDWAFSGRKRLTESQQGQVRAVTKQARIENRESPGKRRSRFWGLGPKWA